MTCQPAAKLLLLIVALLGQDTVQQSFKQFSLHICLINITVVH